MRYNPDTERGITLETIAEQCRGSFAEPAPAPSNPPKWGQLMGMAAQGFFSRRFLGCCELSHGIEVARAMGNWAEVRRLRAQLIAGLY